MRDTEDNDRVHVRHQSVEWLEEMLSYCVNILSQVNDQIDHEDIVATTGPSCDPDRYDECSLVDAIREKYPEF